MFVQASRVLYRVKNMQRTRALWLAALVVSILLGAFALRVAAAGWGLPYVDHHDEPSAANTALRMLQRGDWNPQFFEKPSMYYYALRATFEAHWQYGLMTGLYTDIAQLPEGTNHYVTTPGFFVWGRVLTSIFGALTVGLLFVVGRRWWGLTAGLVAAGIMAVLPFHVRQSQFITVDVLTGLMTLLALFATLRLLDDQHWCSYALAGLAAGLAASAKYNAVLVVLAILVAHWLVWRWSSIRQVGRLSWAALWSVVGFVIGTPYALLTPQAFFDGVMKQYTKYSQAPTGDLVDRWPLGGYLSFFWFDGLTPLVCIAVLIGIVVIVARRDRAGLVLLGFVVPYFLFVLAQVEHFFRNLMPIFPALVVFAAIGIVATVRWLAHTLPRYTSSALSAPRHKFAVTAVLTGLVLVVPLWTSIEQTRLFAQPHSKVRAGDYLRDQLPHGAPAAVSLHPVAWANQPWVTPIENVAQHNADWYRAQGYRYIVGNVRIDHDQYQQLRSGAEVLATFPGELDGVPSPHMEILDLGLQQDQLAIEQRFVAFGDQLIFLGYQRSAGELRSAFYPLDGTASVQPGQALQLNTYWQAPEEMTIDYAMFLHLTDEAGQIVAQRDLLIRAYDYPTSEWFQDELVVDIADLYIPPELGPGEYQLTMGVYDMTSMARLPIAETTESALPLMTVQVGP
ncbi:MAG: glycosyltransferase family 39 protein [Chloroflexota bacterium]